MRTRSSKPKCRYARHRALPRLADRGDWFDFVPVDNRLVDAAALGEDQRVIVHEHRRPHRVLESPGQEALRSRGEIMRVKVDRLETEPIVHFVAARLNRMPGLVAP